MRFEEKAWRESMRLTFDYNGMMKSFIGEHGLSEAVTEKNIAAEQAANAMKTNRSLMKWRELPYTDETVLSEIISTAENIRKSYDAFVVLGIGGSALGPIAVHNALCHLHHNEIKGNIKFYVEDNVDPERLNSLFEVIDPKRTMFNVITKSGGTSETMSQLIIVTKLLRSLLGDDFGKNIIATTDGEKGNLIKIAKQYGIQTFIIPDGVGGRFSELCPVGLLPAAVCGIDIRELLAGARYMDEIAEESPLRKNPAYMFALLQVEAMKAGCNIHVCMPYSDRLRYMADWYAQLWAESLGKRYDRQGNVVCTGQTPVKALGVTDQHSQVQLYTEGPFDKVITFIGVEKFARDLIIPYEYTDIPDVAFLCGHTQGELINTERRATEYAIAKSGHMSNSILLPEINAFTLGELIYMFELQTAFAGELLNINAFDQPGVEEGKNAAYALLGKKGYDGKRDELKNAKPHSSKFIIR